MAQRVNIKLKIGGRYSNVQSTVGQFLGAAIIFSTSNEINGLNEISKIYYEDQPTRAATVRQTLTDRDEGKTFVVESSTFPAGCTAEGPGLSGGEIGIPASFNISTKKHEGGGYPSHVIVQGPEGPIEASLVELGDGSVYGVQFVPVHGGEHVVSVTFSVTKSITIPIGEWIADPIQCIAYGPGLEGGEQYKPAEFTIEARNKLGDKIPIGGHNFKAKVIDPFGGETPVSINDNGDGTYTATYFPFLPGDHVIEVQLGDDHIKDSPFNVKIDDSSETASVAFSYAEGPGLEDNKNNSSQKEPATFTIFAVDRDGNAKASGGDLFDVFVEDPNFDMLPVDIKDNGDGTYTVEYQPKEPGKHHVEVVLRNKEKPLDFEHIKNSPKDVEIKPGTDASHCVAEGPGLKDGILDTFPAEFTIFAKDRNDQPITEGGDPFEVHVLAPDGTECKVDITDNGDGTYAVVYQPEADGPHVVDVTLNGDKIKDCPKTVNVKPGAWAKNCFIENFTFLVRTRDKRGDDLKTGGQDVKAKISDPHSRSVETVKTIDKGDGTYLVEYDLPKLEGKYLVQCTVDDIDIKGSPFEQTVDHL